MQRWLHQRDNTDYVGAGRSGVDYTSTRARERQSKLAFPCGRKRWLPQVPSPAQAANLGWYALWFIGVTHALEVESNAEKE